MLFTHLLRKSDDISLDMSVEIPEKYKQEAELKNLTLICRTNKSHYGLFKFNSCGHEQMLQFSAVRNQNVNCETCTNIKLTNEAESKGLTLLEKYGAYGLYRFNSCGHNASLPYVNVRRSQSFCQDCYTMRITKESKTHGLEFLERLKGVYSKFKITSCGHTKKITNRNAMEGHYKCRDCVEDDYTKYAEAAGIVYIGHCNPPIKDYRLFRLPCGCEDSFQPFNIRSLSWTCKVHDQTAFNRPSSVYLLEFYCEDTGEHFLKLGFSKDSEVRISQYQLPKNFKCTELSNVKTETWQDAIDNEKRLHNLYRDFRLNASYARKILKSGFTECYPIFMKDILLEEMNILMDYMNKGEYE